MSFVFLVAGIIIALFGILKYMTLQQRAAKDYKVLGFNLSEELIWVLMFIVGFIFILGFVIHELEPQFGSRGL